MSVIASQKSAEEWPESWKLLSHGIRTGRYTDAEFLKLEFERLWSKVWQAAARLDEIPEAGDYTTYNNDCRGACYHCGRGDRQYNLDRYIYYAIRRHGKWQSDAYYHCHDRFRC